MRHAAISGLLIALVFSAGARADSADLPPGFDPQRHMRVSEVKDGMTGYGLSVFQGTKIERFEVTVISVLHNFNPKYDVVLVRCKGANLEHTGGIAGMSGSPIFLKDEHGRERMIGAFAYGWPLSKDPVGGVQPIEYMLAIPDQPKQIKPSGGTEALPGLPAGAQTQSRWSIDDHLPVPWKNDKPAPLPLSNKPASASTFAGHADASMRLAPLATPLMTAGVPQPLFAQYQPLFESMGLVPLQAGSAGVNATDDQKFSPLEPGSAIAVPLMTGDMNLTAIGTVTEIVGDRVLAFGHPFQGEGSVQLPMSSGYIHTVIANLNNSFKLGSATREQGTLYSDQTAGIAGRTGKVPQTIPVEIRGVYSDGTRDQVFRFSAVDHPRFTPLLTTLASSVALSSDRELPQYHTLDYDLKLEFENGQTLQLRDRAVNTSTPQLFQMIGMPVSSAMDNPFEQVKLKKVSGTLTVIPEAREAQILSVRLPREKYRPGETLTAYVTYRPFRGVETILPVDFELPRNLPDGEYAFAVMDADHHLADEQRSKPFRFTAESAEEVFAVLRDFTGVKHDALYMRLTRQSDGVAIGRTAMPHLPSSRRQIIADAGLSNVTEFVSSTVKSVPTEYVMEGEARFQITIDKDAKVETASAKPVRNETPALRPAADEKQAAPAEKADSPAESEPASH